MYCRDRSLILLAKHGYNVVRLPRTGIEPLDVLGRDRNGIERLGRLPAIWHSNADVPVIRDGDVAAEIKTISTASLKISLGLQVLQEILAALGATIPRLDFAYNRMESLQLSFQNIRIRRVDPFDVGTYLEKGDLHLRNPWVDRYFVDDETDAYVISEVLESDAVTVITSQKEGTGASIDLSAIQHALGADVRAEGGSEGNSAVTYSGQRHLVFGFKAHQIGFDFDANGFSDWRVKGIDPSRGQVYLDGSEREVASVLLAQRDGSIGRVNLR